MQRVLIMLPECLLMPLLAGCWHEAFHTSVDNATGRKIYAVIHFEDNAVPPGHGYIEAGNGVSLPQKVGDISYIEYQVGETRCRMDRDAVAKAARSGARGVVNVTLSGCDASRPTTG